MNIQTIAEHQVDMDLLSPMSRILDLGCLNFIYCNEMRRLGHTVYAVDIQDLQDEDYHRVAITNYNGYGYILHSADKQAARFVMDGDFRKHKGRVERIKCQTLRAFMKSVGVDFFDLIKMDVEGAEHEIIMSLDKAPSTQLEIEMHMHTGIYTEQAVQKMIKHLHGLGYKTVSHEKTAQHGCGFNYWSSLFLLK
jgi:FkbM family methyltransferase